MGGLIFTKAGSDFFAAFSCSAKSTNFVVRLIAIPDKNRAVPADFLFFGSNGETNFGTENFNFFGGGGVVSSSLVGCGGVSAFLGGGGVEDSGGVGEGCGLGDGGGDGG